MKQDMKDIKIDVPMILLYHHNLYISNPNDESSDSSQVQAYLHKNLRVSCLAAPSSSHAFANITFNFSALLLISCPFSLRHRSIVCRISIPTASRDPVGVSPFLCRVLRPSPVLIWKSSKPAWRFSVT